MYFMLVLNLVSVVVLVVMLLLGVAFLTLLERKMLGYLQNRKGPNKVGLGGIFQPFSDAIKLFSKEVFVIYQSSYLIYSLGPVISFLLVLFIWLTYPIVTNIYFMDYSMLFMFMVMSVASYVVLMMGWSSNSNYSLLGTLRVVAQGISYEVSFMFIILIFMMLSESYSFVDLGGWQVFMWNMVFLFPVFLMFFISILAELNRSPVDFAEGESELVSGFNVEYFGSGFALIFMGEYGMIVFFSMVLSILFVKICVFSSMIISMMVFSSLIICVRGILPRMRYDEMMSLCWKIILPGSLGYVMLVFVFKVFFMGIY